MAFKIFLLFFSTVAFGQLRTTDFQQSLSAKAPRNYIKNSGMEKNSANITDADAIAARVTSPNLEGVASLEIDAGASAEKVVFLADELQTGLLGRTCEASFTYYGDASLYKAYVQLGSTTVSSEQTLTNTGANAQSISLIFPCGSSQPSVHIEATGDGAAFQVDSVYLGQSLNIGSAAQSEVVFKAIGDSTTQSIPDTTPTLVTNWTEIKDTYGEFASDVFTAKKYGEYQVICSLRWTSLSSGVYGQAQLFKNGSLIHLGADGSTVYSNPKVITIVEMAAGDTLDCRAQQSSGGASNIDGSAFAQLFQITRIPTASEQVIRMDAPGVNWTAFTPTGSWVSGATYTGFYKCSNGNLQVIGNVAVTGTPTSAALTINLPSGFAINTAVTGTITAAAYRQVPGSNASIIDAGTEIYNGWVSYNSSTAIQLTTSLVNATYPTNSAQVTQAVPFTFVNTDSIAYNYTVPVTDASPCTKNPQPLIPGSVFSSSAGTERIERAVITPTSAGACTVNSQTGTWIASTTPNAVGDCSLNLTDTLGATTDMVCTGSSRSSNTTGVLRSVAINIASTSQIRVTHGFWQTSGSVQGLDAGAVNLICMRPR